MINLFLIISAVIGAVLILIILFQKTEGGSLGLGTQTSLTGGMTSNKVISLILPIKASLVIDLASRIPIMPAAPIINIFIMPSYFAIFA